MKKKVLSLVMAIAMTLSLAIPAFAANYFTKGTESNLMEQSLTFEPLTFVPTVKLSMPTLGTPPVVLNPYKITFTGTNNKLGGQAVANGLDQLKQVISPVYTIENKTDAVLKYTVSATTSVTDGVTLLDSPVAISETAKQVHLQLVVGTKEETSVTNYGVPNQEQNLDQFDVSKYETLELTAGEVLSSDAVEKSLAAGNSTTNYLVFQFQGDMTRSPASPWTDSDKATCVVKFTFTPDSANDFSVSSQNKVDKSSSDPIANDTDGNPTGNAIVINLPTNSNSQDIAKANVKQNGGGNSAAQATYEATTPNWALVSSGALARAGIEVDSDAGTLSIDPATACARLPKDDTGHDYKIVMSFDDEHKIPRTMDFLVTLKRVSS